MSQLEQNPGIMTLPLTEAQREIWYGAQMSDAVSCSFNQSAWLRLRGAFDLDRLTRSWQRLVDRHEALRATFEPNGDEQRIHPTMMIEIPFVDLSRLGTEEREQGLQHLLQEEVSAPFDLVEGPLYRLGVAKLSENEHALLVTLHHIVCDGCSLGVLVQELGQAYSAGVQGDDGLPDLQMSYSQFVKQQEASLRSPQHLQAESFWLEQYSRPAPTLDLPFDHARPMRRKFTGGSGRIVLGSLVTQNLKRLSAQRRCSLVTTLLAGYALLLHRLSGQSDVVIGLPMSSRSGETGDQLVGHCVNFLPLRIKVDAEASLGDLLGQVWRLMMEAHKHQNYTLGSLLQKLNRPRELNRMPLAPVMFNLDWVQEPLQMDGLEAQVQTNPFCYARFDLSFSMAERDGQLELHCHYSAELFDPQTIDRWLRHYETLLRSIVANPEARLQEFPVLRTPEGQIEIVGPHAEAPRQQKNEPSPAEQAPRGPIEEKLAQIWCEVIGLAEVGRDDSFFEVGGHSLLATQVVSRIVKSFDVDLPLRAIFESPTISALSTVIAAAQTEVGQSSRPSAGGAAHVGTIPRRARDAKAEELLQRLDQLSEEELRALLESQTY